MTPEERRAAKLASQKRWRDTNREKVSAGQKAWRARNAAKVAADHRAWRAENPERAQQLTNEAVARRRARLAGSEPDLTSREWQEILEEFDHACAYCQARDVPLDQEHMTPISRGGRHTASNVVPACRSCNARKGAKNLLEFAAAS